MATTVYKRSGLTGGAATDLDGQDGAALVDGDFAFVLTGSAFYVYLLDDDSGAAESSPTVIAPDTNAGDKRWINQSVSNVTSGVTPPSGVEITGNISGMVTSNHTDTDHDISISAGACFDSTNVFHMSNSSAVVKQIDAPWAAGSAAGGLLNGSVAVSTLYNIYALRKDADATADFGFLAATDAIATYKPAGYTYYRWVGFVVTDASANIRNFDHLRNDVIVLKAAFEILTNVATTGIVAQDISGSIPAGRVEFVTVGANDSATPQSVYMGTNATELYTVAYAPAGVAWSDIMAAASSNSIVNVNPTTAGNVYMYRSGSSSFDVWLKAVKIIR